jgi:hypothetical protein
MYGRLSIAQALIAFQGIDLAFDPSQLAYRTHES